MITIYATGNHGKGYTEIVGVYESWDTIRIRTGLFSKDVVLTFEVKDE